MGVWQTSAWYIRRASSLKQAGVIPAIDQLVRNRTSRPTAARAKRRRGSQDGRTALALRALRAASSEINSRPSDVRPPSDFGAFGVSLGLGVLVLTSPLTSPSAFLGSTAVCCVLCAMRPCGAPNCVMPERQGLEVPRLANTSTYAMLKLTRGKMIAVVMPEI